MIVYDLQAVQSAAHAGRGIGRYVHDLALTLQRHHPGVVDVFAWNDHLPRAAEIDAFPGSVASFGELRGATVDVLHVASPFEALPIETTLAPVAARRLVVTCYDLIPYRLPDVYLTDPGVAARYRARLGLLVSADAVVTDSHYVAGEVAQLLGVDPRRITSIGAGVGERFAPSALSAAERLQQLQRAFERMRAGFVLVPAGMEWRKNVAGVIEAYAALPEALRAAHQLVLQCDVTAGYAAWVAQLAVDAGLAEQPVLTGHVDDDTLVLLMQTAEVVMFPSFTEGFGLPALEALHCGARVICSDTSSLPEIVRDPRHRFDPWSVREMTARLADALAGTVGATLQPPAGGGHNWKRTAAALVEVYGRLRASAVQPAAAAG